MSKKKALTPQGVSMEMADLNIGIVRSTLNISGNYFLMARISAFLKVEIKDPSSLTSDVIFHLVVGGVHVGIKFQTKKGQTPQDLAFILVEIQKWLVATLFNRNRT